MNDKIVYYKHAPKFCHLPILKGQARLISIGSQCFNVNQPGKNLLKKVISMILFFFINIVIIVVDTLLFVCYRYLMIIKTLWLFTPITLSVRFNSGIYLLLNDDTYRAHHILLPYAMHSISMCVNV